MKNFLFLALASSLFATPVFSKSEPSRRAPLQESDFVLYVNCDKAATPKYRERPEPCQVVGGKIIPEDMLSKRVTK